MIETNICIVNNGMNLNVATRRAHLQATSPDPDMIELACLRLRARHQLAAVPDGNGGILVATNRPVPQLRVQERDRELVIDDDGESGTLSLADQQGVQLLPTIVERAVLARLAHQGKRWAISGSPRNWYEKQPIEEQDGISVIRRASIASMFVEGVGVGIAADVQTSFFTSRTADWFFPLPGNTAEIRCRRELFDRLAQREHGKGTLVYHRGETRTTCYFTRAPEGVVCGSTGSFRLNNVTYDSVYDYYAKTAPQLKISPQDRAVWVSFPKAKGDVPVAAKLLRLRVFNDALPEILKLGIPMAPRDRREFVFAFWRELGADVLASIGASFENGLWSPPKGRFWQIPPPPLRFGKNKVLQNPASESDYRAYYGDRIKLLREGGCFQFPAATPRRIQCAYPAGVSEASARQLLTDVEQAFRCWTGKQFSTVPVDYQQIDDAVTKIKGHDDSTMLLFVLDGDPNGYYTVSLELGEYRPKRVTAGMLGKHFDEFQHGAYDRRTRTVSLDKGRNNWKSFVGLIGLDLLQLQDGVPWAIPPGPFEAMLVVDVSHDRRYYGLSLLIVRPDGKLPAFRLITVIKSKADSKEEAINPEVLEEEVVKLFRQNWPNTAPPLASLLILRDGRVYKGEPRAFERIKERLAHDRILQGDGRYEVIEFFKESEKNIRLWEVTAGPNVLNVLEGAAVEISAGHIVLANTGRTTLNHGTAEPIVLHSPGHRQAVRDAATTCFQSAQLNWSNPRVALRYPLPVNRTDEELIARAQQEARHSR
jgi:hypothetical protein